MVRGGRHGSQSEPDPFKTDPIPNGYVCRSPLTRSRAHTIGSRPKAVAPARLASRIRTLLLSPPGQRRLRPTRTRSAVPATGERALFRYGQANPSSRRSIPLTARISRRHDAPRRTQGKIPGRPAQLRRIAPDRERIQPAQAGHDVRDPEEPRRERPGHPRRRHARNPARRLRLPAQPREPTTCPAPTTSMSARARCAASACAPATRSRARSARPRMASATSRCSRSTRSISSRPRRSATASTSTI